VADLIVTEVRKSYRSVEAVRSVSFRLRSGELLCLLGPSGSGKTTTLRMIAGLESPDSGEIRLGDRVLNGLEPRERRIGMVFQGLALYPHMTAFDNIAYPLKVRGVSVEERRRRIAAMAEVMGIGRLLGRRPSQLSGGEQQRVALARALVQEPELFLLDEPLSALDAKVRATMREEIRNVQKRMGISTILVSHDQLDAFTMADVIAVMHQGVIQQIGFPHDIYYRPCNVFVAQFIGDPTMNLVRGEIDGVGRLRLLENAVSLPGGLHAPPGRVIVGLRPQDFRVQDPEDRLPDLAFSGTVTSAQPEGSDIVVRFQIGETALVAKVPWEREWQTGETVLFGFPAERLHVFDEASGRRLDAEQPA
jgi:multiple sugar transport system ATP-binding protein